MSKLEELIKKMCPDGVEYKKLKEVTDFVQGFAFKNNTFKNEGIGLVRTTNIQDKSVSKENMIYIDPKDYVENLEKYIIRKDRILIGMSGTIKVGINSSDELFYLNQRVGMFIPNEKIINNKFLFYILDNSIPELYNLVSGSSVKNLSSNTLNDFRIAVPPLEVQREIVHILDDFTLLSAELSAELKARKNQYNYYLEKLLCNDKNAKTYKLKELCVFFNGDRGKNYPKVSEMVNKGVPFVNAGDVNRVIDYKNCNKITLEKYNSMNGAKLRKNDILYCLRGSTGKNGIYELDEGTVASSLVAIRVNSIINYKYLYYLLNSSLERRQRYKSDTGAAQPNLSVQSISNYEFPVPNMEEQNKIVNILDKFEKLCNDISEGLPAEIEARQKQYEYYRDKLLNFKELKIC